MYTKVWQPYKLSLQLFGHTILTDMHNLLSIIGNSQLTFPSKEMCMWKERIECSRKKIDGNMTLKGVNARQSTMRWNRDVKRNCDWGLSSQDLLCDVQTEQNITFFFFSISNKDKSTFVAMLSESGREARKIRSNSLPWNCQLV